MTTQADNWETLVVGLGQTGLSVARHLQARGVAFAVVEQDFLNLAAEQPR